MKAYVICANNGYDGHSPPILAASRESRVTAKYTNEIRYDFDLHQVRLIFFDRAMQFEGLTGTPTHNALEQVAELVMTRQTFRAYLQILNDMASRLQPIGIPDPADREPEPAPNPFHHDPVMDRDR